MIIMEKLSLEEIILFITKKKQFYSGSQILKTGRFLRQKYIANRPLFSENEEAKNKESLTHIYTLEGREDIYHYQFEMIKNAKSSIHLVSFVFDDDPLIYDIVDLLIQKVAEGVNVKVFTTLKTDDFNVKEIAEIEDIDFNHHMKMIEQMSRHGIRIRARKDCHGKFCVADQKFALISSANLTGFSYNRNPEFGCFFSNKLEVLKLDYIFNHLWDEAYQFFVNNDNNNFYVQERTPKIASYRELFPFKKSHTDYEILYTYVDNKKFSESVTNLFKKAKNHIVISTYLVRALENTPVGIELLNALERGVKVSIITRPANRRSDHLDGCQKLFEKGAVIYGNLFNHAKIFTVDEQCGVIFTGNLDGVHGIENGIEFGIHIKNPSFLQFPLSYNQYLIEESEFTFKTGVTQKTLSETQNQQHRSSLPFDEISLYIPETLEIGRMSIDGSDIFHHLGEDEVRFSYEKKSGELKIIIPEYALIFSKQEQNDSFQLEKAFHPRNSMYQTISKELSAYLIDKNVHVSLFRSS